MKTPKKIHYFTPFDCEFRKIEAKKVKTLILVVKIVSETRSTVRASEHERVKAKKISYY